ncbi:histone-lysine N-methyltransferase SETMAR [Trichonephila clavipes]|nr:histone-lysine N-methyltransferase SETMAR [Trichonephila clavipes]
MMILQYGGQRQAEFSNDRNRHRTIEEMIQNVRRVTLSEISSELALSYGSVQRVVSEVLQYSKVSGRWFLRTLSDEQKATRMMCCLTFLQRYHSYYCEHSIDHIVIGDETWIHHLVPTSRKATMEWKNPGSKRKRKFKVRPFAYKVMATKYSGIHAVLS